MQSLRFLLPVMMMGLFACSSGPKQINFGKEECVFCKMTILDRHFACQVVNKKTKAYNFDDISCMIGYLQTGIIQQKDIAGMYVPEYTGNNELLPAAAMNYVVSEMFHSPMSGNAAAFSNLDSARVYQAKFNGTLATWEQIKKDQ